MSVSFCLLTEIMAYTVSFREDPVYNKYTGSLIGYTDLG